MIELIDTPQKLEDLPEEFRINRYSFRFDLKNDTFLISKERTSGYGYIIGASFFGGFAVLFAIIGYIIHKNDGQEADLSMPIFFGSFFLLLTLIILYLGYFNKSNFVFEKDGFSSSGRFFSSEKTLKENFESVYVKRTITQDQYGKETAFHISVCLKRKVAFGRQSTNDVVVCQLDEKNSLAQSFGIIDHSDRLKVENEAVRIGRIIEVYWDVPFRV